MKTKTKFLSVLCALFMLIVSVMGLGGAIRAYGETEELIPYYHYFPEPVSDEEYVANPDESLTSLYYFSDYDGSEDIFENGFVRNYINQNPNIEKDEAGGVEAYLYYLGGGIDDIGFWDKMTIMWLQLRLDEIENAFIIFEVRESFEMKLIEREEDFPNYWDTNFGFMDEMFSAWKNNDCKIMFIDGLNEVWYKCENDSSRDYTGFLEYVDIHIDVDFQTTYAYTALYYMTNNFQNLENMVIVFDKRLSEAYWMYKVLASYILYTYQLGTIYNEMQPFANIGIYSYLYDSEYNCCYDFRGIWSDYIDCSNNDFCVFYGEDVVRNILDGKTVYVIGNSQTPWDPNLYMHLNLFNYSYENFMFDYPQNTINHCIGAIMRDFILNDTDALAKYDNRPEGRCIVTFKPLFYSENGWLRSPDSIQEWINCFLNASKMDLEFVYLHKTMLVGVFG